MRSQKSLFDYFDKKDLKRRYGRTEYGGQNLRGHRKLERPLSTKKWIHLVLKSDKAVKELSFLLPKNRKIVDEVLKQKGRKFGVKMTDFANVGNHLHVKIKIKSRRNFQAFLKAVTTLIARKMTGAKRGIKFGRFWQGLAYTRVLSSNLEELYLRGYFEANRQEADHGHETREEYLNHFNAWVRQEREKSG